MSKQTKICQVCLRADRKLKAIDSKLSDFHDELCDFSIMVVDPVYCSECGYLLKKLYNFKAKCVMAAKIIKMERKKKSTEKKPANLLYTLLPPISLGIWTPNNTKIIYIELQEDPVSNKVTIPLSISNTIPANTASLVTNNMPCTDVSASFGAVEVPAETFVDVNNLFETKVLDDSVKQELIFDNTVNEMYLEVLPLKTEEVSYEDVVPLEHGDLNNSDIECDTKVPNEGSDYSDKSDDGSTGSDYHIKDLITSKKKRNGVNKHCDSKLKAKLKKESLDKSVDSNDVTKETSVKNKNIANEDGKPKKSSVKRKTTDKVSKRKRRKVSGKDANIKQRFHTRRGILAELANVADSDDEVLEKIKLKRSKVPFSKERLKAELTERFSACGDIITDGITIDKEFIIACLDDKATEFVTKQLWNAIHGKFSFKPKALKLFRSIQNKYKNEYGSVFDIEYLNTKEKMMEEFERRKTYEIYVNSEFKCEICYIGFKHEKKLEYHKKCHDEKAGTFICPICNVRLKTRKSLMSHFNSHEAVYKCKLCPLITYWKVSMVNHYQLHKGVKFRCEPCDTTFGSRSAYATHISYRHQRRHVCTACGRAFFTEIGLKWHKTRSHQNEVPNVEGDNNARCFECSLTFPSEEVYRRHVRITHEVRIRGRKPGTVVSYNPQSAHRPRKKPVLTCRVCSAVGHSIGWLTLHVNTEHPDKDMATLYADKHTHLCHVCGKGFSTVYTLKAHLNTHSGVRPFPCASCPARFHRAVSLRLHGALHAAPARPCPHCGKKFRSQSNLANHIRFHIGDRRYKCKICGKGFLHRGTLNEHVRGVHHNVRRVRKRGGAQQGGCETGGGPVSQEEGL